MSITLKGPEEIETMREGGRRHAEILRTLAGLVAPGVSTQELEDEARKLVEEGGDLPAHLNYTPRGAGRPFPAVLCVSINNEVVHGIPNEDPKVLEEGDIVTIDLSLTHKGLITDSAITVPVGKIDDISEHLLDTTKKALYAGIKAAQPGHTVGHIGEAVSAVVESAGLSLAEDLAGHGVGYSVHEDPFVPNVGKAGSGERLVPGMVIAIEPMVHVGKPGIKVHSDGYTISTRDGSRSAHFEHTVVITEKGHIILTEL